MTATARREVILRVAERKFATVGYEGTSLRDIADEAGVLKGSLYHYFESKEEILFEVARKAHSVSMDNLVDGSTGPADSAVDVIRRFVERNVRFITENSYGTAAFYAEMRHLTPAHAEEIVALRQQYETTLTDLIRDGQADGTIMADTPPRLLANAILGLINSIIRWYQPDGEWTADDIAAVFGSIAAKGVRS